MKTCPFCAEEIQDAAIVCKHCQRDLSAVAPVGTGTIVPPVRKHKMGWFAKSLFALVAVLGVGFLTGVLPSGTSDGTSPKVASLSADVQFTGTAFTIRNNDTWTWTNGKAEVNGVLNGYEATIGNLKPGESVTIPALQFAKGTERFNPFQFKPTESYIYVDDGPSGKGVWQGQIK